MVQWRNYPVGTTNPASEGSRHRHVQIRSYPGSSAIKIENVAYRAFDSLYRKGPGPDDGRHRKLAGIAQIHEPVLKSADSHVGDFANGIGNPLCAVCGEFQGIHLKRTARHCVRKILGHGEVHQTIQLTTKPDITDDQHRTVVRGGDILVGTLHEHDLHASHGLKHLLDGMDHGIVDEGISQGDRSRHDWQVEGNYDSLTKE